MALLTGKIALITGASRGIGRATARALSDAGAAVYLAADGTREELSTVAAECRAQNAFARAEFGMFDLSDIEDVRRMVDAALASFGRVDILVNNAGMSPLAPSLTETSEELFDKVIDVNFKGPFRLSSLIGERMAAGNGGVIINLSSTAAFLPMPHTIPYGGAKAAINVMTVALAKAFAPKVRVNCIAPGPFLTDVSTVRCCR